jgi:hypothetical protein
MNERDADIDFDFFEEPETREAAPPERPARRGPRPPVRPPTNLTPLLRLVGLIAFAILIVVLLVRWGEGCAASSKHDKYAHYMTKVSEIAGRSQQIGREYNDLLTTPDVKQADLQRKLADFARREELDVEAARGIDPPGRLRDEHEHLIEALQFRVSGLTGLADSFRRAAKTKNAAGASALLAAQADRLLASDVVWDDNFKDPAKQVLKSQGVGDVRVPDSNFLVNPELASQRSMSAVLQRLGGTTARVRTGGLHGTNIISVKALPQGNELTTGTDNKVVATSDLAFAVTVEDSGDSPEVGIPVTLTIQQSRPIVKKATIDFINPGEQKTVTLRNIGAVAFATRTTVKVEVQPVPGEHNTSNNTADYPVIFSLS